MRKMRLGIGSKLSAGFILILILLGVSGGWSYLALSRLDGQYGKVVEGIFPLALVAEQLNSEIQTQSQLLMAYAATRDDRQREIKQSRQLVDGYIAQLEQAGRTDEDLATKTSMLVEQRKRFDRMVDGLFVNGADLQAYQLVLQADNARAIGEVLGKQTKELRTLLQTRVDVARSLAKGEAQVAFMVLTAVLALSVLVGIGVTVFVYRVVALPLRAVALQLKDIASGAGDLTKQLKVSSNDEIGLLAESFNQLVQGLAGIVRRVILASDEMLNRSEAMERSSSLVADAVSGVSAGVGQVASGADRQSSETGAARETMTELVSAIDQIARGAQQQALQVQDATITISSMVQAMERVAAQTTSIAQASREAATTAHQGAAIVDQTLLGMNQVRDRVVGAAVKVSALGDHGKRIGEIMQVISDIASQTNLLALNAAIEAARAGEQGRGFAVVAEEVRKLAERSALSATEIRNIIQSIQAGTKEAVAAIQEGSVQVEEGAELAAAAGKALKEILRAVESTTGDIREISEAAQLVLASSRDAARAVEEVAAVTQENSAATEEMAAGADEVKIAIEGVSEISQENGAAVSSVSATIHQVNQSVGSIAESARRLSGTAAELRKLVGQFRI